jgi:hypothetical protein
MEENFPFVLDHKNIFHIEQRFHLEYFQYILAYFVDVILYNDQFLFLTIIYKTFYNSIRFSIIIHTKIRLADR